MYEVVPPGWLQVVMPSVGADVAFGLGRQELTRDEIRKRVEESLRAVGMEEYMEVSDVEFITFQGFGCFALGHDLGVISGFFGFGPFF